MVRPSGSIHDTQRSSWPRLALPASLLLNLFLIALIGGYMLHNPPAAPLQGSAWAPAGQLRIPPPPQDAYAFNNVPARDLPHTTATCQNSTHSARTPGDRLKDGFIQDVTDTRVDSLGQVSPEGRRQLLQAVQKGQERMLGPSIP